MKHFVGSVAVLVLLCLESDAGPQPKQVQTPCHKSRKVFTEPWGIVTDGPIGSNYTHDSHCEWLIKANSSEQYITLKFLSMGTECSFDYVYVYDGDSFNSPMLGSFSGNTEPQQVTATSGFMLILLYSDTNYALDGFRAEYSISNCSGNCSGHGVCVAHSCICENGWGGRDCGRELCPDKCGSSLGRGHCVLGQCHCSSGYSGQSCSLYIGDPVGNRWHWIYEGVLTARAAHTAIYINETDALYVFGGYDLNSVLGDLHIFRFNLSQWEDEDGNIIRINSSSETLDSRALLAVLAKVGGSDDPQTWGLKSRTFFQNVLFTIADNHTFSIKHHGDNYRKHTTRVHRMTNTEEDDPPSTPSSPEPRYSHAACNYPGGFVLYGGKMEDGSLSSELWLYEVTGGRWSLRAGNSKVQPPPLARHTITLTSDGWIYLVGGSTEQGQFSSKVFKIKLTTVGGTEEWSEVIPRGGKELDVRIVAHSTVYNSQAGSLLVYGGLITSIARFAKLSDRMFSFHLASRHWTEIHYPRAELRDTYVPRERAFHTTTIIGNYLVVFGGYTHRHNKEEVCYDKQLYLYHLGCHTWVSHDILGIPDEASRYPKKQGVFAHAAALRNGNTLLLAGGYHGNMNADLLAFTLPPTIASRHGETYEPEAVCSRHHTLSECTANPECGWCSADVVCYGRTLGINCTTNLQTTRCPGICPGLGDCHSCLLHGAAPGQPPAPAAHSVAHKLHLGQCTWCVQNARCHHKDDNFGVCGLREDTPSQVAGWWGDKGSEVMSADMCKQLDRRPGLTFLKYKYPANLTQPDSVSIINATIADFSGGNVGGGAVARTDQALGGEMTARLLGFLRPPHTWENVKEQVRICVSYATALLKLAPMDNHLEVVANLTAEQNQCMPALWPSGAPTVLLPGRYLVDFESRKTLTNSIYSNNQHWRMELLHNKSLENPKVFTFEYLEPYEGNGTCSIYTNCLHCLSDSLCGWCDANSQCMPRRDNEMENCHSLEQPEDWHYLTLVPSQCANCSNFVDCEPCIDTGICEWWPDDAKCARRGRASHAVTEISKCPAPCYGRENCTQCLDGNGRCVWCLSTQECFSFAVYTSQYQFGMCREWLDQPYHSQHSVAPRGEASLACDACGRHSNCSTCLRTLGCGWCYDLDNPIQGVCVPGDFSQPYVESCNLVVNEKHNTSFYSDEVSWSYAQCPDVDECGLGLHDCHPEAKCTNTHGSYSCQCRRGFVGDGKNSCKKTCYNKCVYGYCLGAPQYTCKCDLGWTGPDCATNCGCNNHSTCSQGVGVCDECQHWTTGEFCQYCRAGSFGNATTSAGCEGCTCNEHGNPALGICDSLTGDCFCQDNTEGPTCNQCRKGYYGDPRRGGTCYFQCMARGMLTSSETQGLGSRLAEMSVREFRQGPPSRECLWIVSPHDLHNKSEIASVIQLTIDSDIAVTCTENSVYVYDGLPDFVTSTGSHQSHVLGVFCTQDIKYPVTVEAKSGILTVHYKKGEPSEGFNATVTVLSCPDKCPMNRVCRQGQCACPDWSTGPDCSDLLCPNNCSADLKQGVCDKSYGRCLCAIGWGGPQCSIRIHSWNPTQIVFTELFNSAHLADNLDHLRKMLPRFGHSLLTDRRGSLWLFGGYSLSHGPLNDIRLFDTKNNTWMQITVDSTNDANMPRGRYFHAAEIVQSRREIFVYGGLTQKDPTIDLFNNTLNDFWKFSLKNTRWIDIQTLVEPPPLAGHTLTLFKSSDSESLILIGGFSPKFGFSKSVWEFNLASETWSELETTGNGPLGVYGHSTVFHAKSESFYVYGGYMYGVNRTFVSNKLYAFYYRTRTWTVLPTFEEYNPRSMNLPHARFLHTAVTTDDFLLVFGGRTEPQTSDSLIAYSYSCNQWIKILSKDVEIVGNPPPATYAHAMTLDPVDLDVSNVTVVYVMGGFAGGIQSHVTRISLPSDLCRLWQGKDKCRSFLGCSFCAVIGPNGNSTGHCYSNTRGHNDPCQDLEGTHKISNGVNCSKEFFSQRTCAQYKSCTDCLGRWPTRWDEPQVCKWCGKCAGCVNTATSCDDASNKCRTTSVTTDVNQCVETQCAASDCEKCQGLGNCLWTRQVLLTPEQGVKVTGEPVYDWNCVAQDYTERSSIKLKSSGAACPLRCSQHKDCDSCLSSQGAEGGWHECHWSTGLNECVSPGYQPLYCAGGVCGLVLSGGSNEHCPQACSSYKQCSYCLRHAHCGWCSLEGTNTTGQGVCYEGSLDRPASGPARSSCDVLYGQEYGSTAVALPDSASFSWNYVHCPPENECLNGHHSCDERSEECVDLPDGYRCICGKGYRSERSECVPVCAQGCVRGTCMSPDYCRCDFGYVGANCSIQCQCNGHSECSGPDKLDTCLACHNNTQGPQCQRCKPLFVGDPTDSGECVPCVEYCNGHTHLCINDSITDFPFTPASPLSEVIKYLGEGPTTRARCVWCGNRTTGDKCEGCLVGNFRGTEDHRVACRPCECHGHGDTCDPVTGEKCNCANNTESDAACQSTTATKNNHHCWMLQCSKCKESYSGTPTGGHQCYKQMSVDYKFCLDAKLIEECKMKPKALNPFQTVFFMVQPRFMNVDIRLTVDVTQGGLDLFLSPRDDTFVVDVNITSGEHSIKMDRKYISHGNDDSFQLEFDNGTTPLYHSGQEFTVVERIATGLTTFITLNQRNTLLFVRNLTDRLVLTLPQDKHDLGSTRFYIALTAVGRPAYGTVFFRQDQLHIDLFVFFSVFFSCFFLFLAACVVAWKAKQAADVRRARRRHVVEMLHMAKRPFASVTLLLESGRHSPHRTGRRGRSRLPGEVRPVAVEPTDDGIAAVGTVFVRLPGGPNAPVKIAMASTLILLARVYPNNNRAFLRRRSSHS